MAVAALWRTIRRRPPGWGEMEPVDPRAEEFESAETTVDAVEAVPQDPDERRRAVHAEGRSVVDRMRKPSAEE